MAPHIRLPLFHHLAGRDANQLACATQLTANANGNLLCHPLLLVSLKGGRSFSPEPHPSTGPPPTTARASRSFQSSGWHASLRPWKLHQSWRAFSGGVGWAWVSFVDTPLVRPAQWVPFRLGLFQDLKEFRVSPQNNMT